MDTPSLHIDDNVGYRLIDQPTRHFSKTDSDGAPILIEPKFIVLHCIASHNPLAFLDEEEVSAHYLIPTQTTPTPPYEIVQLLNDHHRAWHAGECQWGDITNLNDCAIGIEINMPNYANYLRGDPTTKQGDFRYVEPFQEAQVSALIALVKDLQKRHTIPAQNVLAHSDIAPFHENEQGVVAIKKTDPGPTLPWRLLARHGIGVFPQDQLHQQVSTETLRDAAHIQTLLQKMGYGVANSGDFDEQTLITINALRHFHYNEDHTRGIVPLVDLNTLQKQGVDKKTYTYLYNLAHGRVIPPDLVSPPQECT